MDVQAVKDEVGKVLDDLRNEAQQFMNNMTDIVQDGKRKHQELSTEVSVLCVIFNHFEP